MNLLERAKARGSKVRGAPPRKVTREELELAIAWLKGEVTYSAVVRVMKLTSGSNVYGFIAIGLREAYKQSTHGHMSNGECKVIQSLDRALKMLDETIIKARRLLHDHPDSVILTEAYERPSGQGVDVKL